MEEKRYLKHLILAVTRLLHMVQTPLTPIIQQFFTLSKMILLIQLKDFLPLLLLFALKLYLEPAHREEGIPWEVVPGSERVLGAQE